MLGILNACSASISPATLRCSKAITGNHHTGRSEYSYFIALESSPKLVAGLTSAEQMAAVAPDEKLLDSCGDKRSAWFLPKPIGNYEVWLSKAGGGYRLFRDKADGTLFLCDERL